MMTCHTKRLFLLFVLGLTIGANSFAADWYTDSNNLKFLIDTDNGTATLYANNYTGDIDIPENVKVDETSYKVIALADSCFKGCKIGKVTIPTSVKKLGDYCFTSSTLSSIDIPNSVTELGDCCFEYCSWLYSITIPNSITILPYCCFYFTDLRLGISLPNTLKTIKSYCFSNSSLRNIELPSSITEIQDRAFSGCKLLSSIVFPENLKEIGALCLASCTILTNVKLPENLEVLDGCFMGCESLESISIPNTVKKMSSTFQNCEKLKQITIPPLVTTLSSRMFDNCLSLETITIGSGVKEISSATFIHCEKLNKINCYAEEVPTLAKGSTNENPFKYIDSKNCILNVPKGSIQKYQEAEYWKDFSIISSINTPEPGADVLTANITDAEPNIPEGTYYAGNLTYTRTGDNIAPGKYASLCLPFDINLTETDCFSSVFIPINMALYNTYKKSLTMMLDKADLNTAIKAGQPFIAKLSSDKIELKNCNSTYISSNYADQKIETTFKVYDTTGESGVLQQNQDLDVRFGGTYQRMEGLDKTVYKTFYTDGRLYNGEVVTPFRAYLYKANAAAQAAVQSITWGVGDETTGIKYIVTPELKPTDNKVFTLDGKLVNQTGDTKSLKKGIYIINGRKIFIK